MRYLILCVFAMVVGSGDAIGQSADDLKRTFEQIARDQSDAMEWRELVCVPKARLDCGSASCDHATPSVHVRLKRENLIRGTISRCDRSCDTYEASISTGGIFTNLQPVDPRGFFVKVRGAQE